MYGTIYGDLAGSIYEYGQIKKIKSIHPESLIEKDSFYSDDTILTIAILEAILDNKDYGQTLREYIQKYGNYRPDFSPYFDSAFSPGLTSWSNSDKIGTSHGNGALMRISPVGFMFDSEKEVIENAKLATMPSHNSKEAIEAATTIALMIYYFKNGRSKEEVFRKMNINIRYVPFLDFNRTCEKTIGNCLYGLYYSDSFEDAIRKTLRMGGDTDTNCAIVGGIAEALYGINDDVREQVEAKIPDGFVKVLRKAKKKLKWMIHIIMVLFC